MEKLKVGDVVQVMAGAERSLRDLAKKRGKILAIDRETGRVRVEGLRLVKRHLRKGRDRNTPEGGIIEKAGTIARAAVQVVCSKCDRPVRLGIRLEGEKKVRYCKACEARIDA